MMGCRRAQSGDRGATTEWVAARSPQEKPRIHPLRQRALRAATSPIKGEEGLRRLERDFVVEVLVEAFARAVAGALAAGFRRELAAVVVGTAAAVAFAVEHGEFAAE